MSPAADGERHIESGSYPASRNQTPLSVAVILISIIVFAMRFSSATYLQGLSSIVLACVLVFLFLGAPQILGFNKIREGVMENGVYVTGTGARGTGTRFFMLIAFFLLVTLGPFILSAVLSPPVWLGAVLGMIMGFSVAQLTIIYYVGDWEKKSGLKLESYQIWVYDAQNRVKVIERGVRKKI